MHSRCGRCFFSTPRMLAFSSASFVGGLGLRAHVLEGAGEEAAGAAGRVEDGLAELRVDHVDDELGRGARGVELAGVAGALEVLEELLVDVAEHVAGLGVVEVDVVVDLVDDLAHERAGLHVVVGVLEHAAQQLGPLASLAAELGDVQVLERREQRVVDEVEQIVAGGGVMPTTSSLAQASQRRWGGRGDS